MASVEERLNNPNIGFTVLRLVLAVVVLTSHEWPIGGYGREPAVLDLPIGHWAVTAFFALSGFLVTRSRMRTDLGRYLTRRMLRIYPGYLACLCVIAFVFAPLSTVWAGGGSWRWSSAAGYLFDNLSLKIEQNGIANTLPHVPFARAWDGSLWTLFYDLCCYIGVGLVLTCAAHWHHPLTIAAWCCCAAVDTLQNTPDAVHDTTLTNLVYLGSFFFAGALIAQYSDRIPVDLRLAALSVALAAVAAWFGLLSSLGSPAVAYLCVWTGLNLAARHRKQVVDLSFGVFLYAFPVQQMLNFVDIRRLPAGIAVAVAISVTLPIAALSWKYLESPALRLKARLTGPGSAHSSTSSANAVPRSA